MYKFWASLGGSDCKESACRVGDPGSIPGLGRSPRGGQGNPLQYSCLENLMNRGAWRAMVHRVAQSQTRLKQLSTHSTVLSFLLPHGKGILRCCNKWIVQFIQEASCIRLPLTEGFFLNLLQLIFTSQQLAPASLALLKQKTWELFLLPPSSSLPQPICHRILLIIPPKYISVSSATLCCHYPCPNNY